MICEMLVALYIYRIKFCRKRISLRFRFNLTFKAILKYSFKGKVKPKTKAYPFATEFNPIYIGPLASHKS